VLVPYHMQEKKSWSNPWHKLYPLTVWVLSSFRLLYVSKWKGWWIHFIGGSKKNGRHSINWMQWGKFTLHKSLGEQGWNHSIFQCLVNIVGNSCTTQTPYSLVLSKPNTSQDGISWKHLLVTIQATLGGVYGVPNLYLPLGKDGRSVMAQKLICGVCLGYATSHLANR